MNDDRPTIEDELKDLWDLVSELESVSERLRTAADRAVAALRPSVANGGIDHA